MNKKYRNTIQFEGDEPNKYLKIIPTMYDKLKEFDDMDEIMSGLGFKYELRMSNYGSSHKCEEWYIKEGQSIKKSVARLLYVSK